MLWNWMNINLCPVSNKWTACSTKESQLTLEYNKVHTKNDMIQNIHTYIQPLFIHDINSKLKIVQILQIK